MSEMRLIVMGAGGRMGRNLVRAIAESSGAPVALKIRRLPSPNGIRYFSQPEERKTA